LFWGFLILMERLFFGNILRKIPSVFGHLYLLFAMIMSWALFYFTDLNRLWKFFTVIFGSNGNTLITLEFKLIFMANIYWLAFALVFCMPVYLYMHRFVKRKMVTGNGIYWWAQSYVINGILLALATMMLVGSSYNPFIYYRF
jgi:alginate O-acetyltransferase complex protein AlgI